MIKMFDDRGVFLEDDNMITFQIGGAMSSNEPNEDDPIRDPEFVNNKRFEFKHTYLNVNGYNVLCNGGNNRQPQEIEHDFTENRLLPGLIEKQCTLQYGKGPQIYRKIIEKNKIRNEWEDNKQIQEWLDRWPDYDILDYKTFGMSILRNYYYHEDYWVKWRFLRGKLVGNMPVGAFEIIDNAKCRLATDLPVDIINNNQLEYKDFRYVLSGDWDYLTNNYKTYPRFILKEIQYYKNAAISHHRVYSPGTFYGRNDAYLGIRNWLKGSNDNPEYINSFLRHRLAVIVHVIIPNAWIESKRIQITRLCEENVTRKNNNESLYKYNGIEIGTQYSEAYLIKYMALEMRKLSKMVSGKRNQGKMFNSISFRSGDKEIEQWQINPVDLKSKEYLDGILAYDKRADEVLTSSMGIDSSLSNISKEGIISKSGSDVYYNYLLYLLTLPFDDNKCSEIFDLGIRVNFPDLYVQGFRMGYYREMPSRQEDVSVNDRMQNQIQ